MRLQREMFGVLYCRIHCVMHTLRLVNVFANYYSSLPAFPQIFAGIRHYIGLLPLAKYPEQLKVRVLLCCLCLLCYFCVFVTPCFIYYRYY